MAGRNIHCITFDLDDTIWACDPVIIRATNEFHKFLSSKFPKIEEKYPLKEFMNVEHFVKENQPNIAHDMTIVRKKALEYCALQTGYDPLDVVEDAFHVFITHRQRVEDHIYPNVITTLEALQERGYIIGAVSDGNSDTSKIPSLAPLFSFHVSAASAGASKPHKAPFTKATDLAGVAARNCVHVGDNFEKDVIGAMSIGMKTVWLNHKGLENDGNGSSVNLKFQADAVIQSIDEIIGVVEEFETR